MSKDKTLYDENSIVSETSREFCRRAPSTYLGSSKSNTNLIKEVFANSIDEHVIGHGDLIKIDIDTNKNLYQIEDFGQGFPINAKIDKDGEDVLQRCFDKLNTSGKTTENGVYSGTSLGLNGIGAKLTNWLSLQLEVWTYNNGQEEYIKFKDGIFVDKKIKSSNHNSGTIVKWQPDPQFFKENKPDKTFLNNYLSEISALCPKLTIETNIDGKEKVYNTPNGLNDLLDKRVDGKELFNNRFSFTRQIGKEEFTIALTYTSDYSDNIQGYVNLGYAENGAHISSFKSAYTKAINKYANDLGLLKKNDKNLNSSEIATGLVCVFNIKTTSAKYDGQSKNTIDDIDPKIINQVMSGDFATWLNNNANEAKIIINKALEERKAKEAAKKAKERIRDTNKKKKKFIDMPSKLSDAYSKDRSKCEIMLCLKGDTKIKLLDGTNPTIESLVGKKDIWAYSTNERGSMIPAKIKEVFETQKVNKMLKLTFSDGSMIECTPEHKFLDRDTITWIQAKDLVENQSLFSLDVKLNVVKIEEIIYKEKIPVYCLNIDNPFHSFVLDNGIISHNCEGDSAGNGMIAIKNPEFQAVFPLRGKVLNVRKQNASKIYANKEISDLAKALGLQTDTDGTLIYDEKRLRYGKIILLCDSDADGDNIKQLLLTAINWLCPELITKGHVYDCLPPLFRITTSDNKYIYCNNQQELDEETKKLKGKYLVNRMKGLGEMDPAEQEYCLLDPKTRNVRQITVEDYKQFDNEIEMFMGGSVDDRRNFLLKNNQMADRKYI